MIKIKKNVKTFFYIYELNCRPSSRTGAEFAKCSARTAAPQPINFVTLTLVTNNASCNWVSLVHVSSVQFSSSAVNTALLFNPKREADDIYRVK